ncbi:MAG: hypothetical protein H6719_13135 [Sandaracinaceae bacterium]|nr:hypothetical protein [Sandaracinaceae bacterium]
MRALWLVLAIAATGCATNVGPEGLVIGGPCIDEFDCANGSYCIRRSDFPNGTCTTNCRDDGDCRGDSRCAELESGVCLLSCETDPDCGREGYTCRSLAAHGLPEQISVCSGG